MAMILHFDLLELIMRTTWPGARLATTCREMAKRFDADETAGKWARAEKDARENTLVTRMVLPNGVLHGTSIVNYGRGVSTLKYCRGNVISCSNTNGYTYSARGIFQCTGISDQIMSILVTRDGAMFCASPTLGKVHMYDPKTDHGLHEIAECKTLPGEDIWTWFDRIQPDALEASPEFAHCMDNPDHAKVFVIGPSWITDLFPGTMCATD